MNSSDDRERAMRSFHIIKAIKGNERIALRYANYNWFLAGSFLSRTGEWFDRIALNWFVFTVTDSPFYIGLVEFFRLIPVLFFSPVAGVAADKWDQRLLLLWTQVGAMLTTFGLAFYLLAGTPSFWVIGCFIVVRGFFLAFEIPVRSAWTANLVPKTAIMSAVSLYSATLNTARIVGPALAGLLLVKWNPANLILMNAISFLAVIGTLLLIKTHSQTEMSGTKTLSVFSDLKEAVQYMRRHPVIFGVFILGIVPMIFGFPYTTLMPVFAKEVLHVGPEGFGMLLSFAAAGSVFAALLLGWGKYPFGKGKLLFGSILGFGLALVLFAVSSFYPLSLAIMFIIGAVSQSYRIVERVIIQETVPEQMRGRILGIVMMDSGLVPLGTLFIGSLAEYAGPIVALGFMGLVCIGTVLAVTLRNKKIVHIP
jgi:MFS family permease